MCAPQRIPSPLFVLEIWKACFVGLIECPEGTEELKWTAFTFLKVGPSPSAESLPFPCRSGRAHHALPEHSVLLSHTLQCAPHPECAPRSGPHPTVCRSLHSVFLGVPSSPTVCPSGCPLG